MLVTFSTLCGVLFTKKPVDSSPESLLQFTQIMSASASVINNILPDVERDLLCTYICLCAQDPEACADDILHFIVSGFNKCNNSARLDCVGALNLVKYKYISLLFNAGITVVDNCPLLLAGVPG